MQEYTYTNSTNPFFNNLKHFKRILNIPARKKRIVRLAQLPAVQIINLLEVALNSPIIVTIQTNDSFYSEDVHEHTGYLIQYPDGQLVVKPAFSRVAHPIMPENIRHIRWMD